MSFNLILRSGKGKNEDGESGLPCKAAAHPLVINIPVFRKAGGQRGQTDIG